LRYTRVADEQKSEPKLAVSREYSVLQPGPQKAYLIAEADWRRIKRMLAEIIPPENIYQQIGSGSVGVLGSSIFALVSLKLSSSPPPSWAWTVVTCVFIGSLVGAIAFYIVDSVQKRATVRTVESVQGEMGDIEQSCTPVASAEASSGIVSVEKTTLIVLSAMYGEDGHRWKDVTSLLNGRIKAGKVRIPVNNEELGPDPVPNVRKKIRVAYLLDGEARCTEALEGEELSI
jgi:hypothetical protein